MKSRFCEEFEYQKQHHFHRTLPPEQMMNNIIFSVEVWPPFINLINLERNSSTVICGPLLGYLIELANRLKSNITYIPDLGNETLPFSDFKENGINVVLSPYTPMNLFNEHVQEHIHLSRIMSDVPMMSIISGTKKLKINWSVFNSFNDPFVHLYALYFIFIGIFILTFNRLIFGSMKLKIIYDMIRTLFGQPIPRLDYDKKIRFLLLNLIWLTFFLKLFLSYILLALNQFGHAYDRIDTLDDLVNHRNMKVFLFKGEPSQTILTAFDHPFYYDLENRFLIEDPPNEDIEDWENKIANEINDRKLAMISDEYYLDYFQYVFLNKFPNLYRSIRNDVVLPYFLPLSNKNSNEMDHSLNEMIISLSENGLYNYWVIETLNQNKVEIYTKMNHKHTINDFEYCIMANTK
ncbi:hypothetical protein HUG17_8906 [Dermatophagoides farinae]|uniref:Uncharacterized protein n=1 Tax=Dermatophagoides farinae TaxID=6954 RepID=A0A9D4NTF6_DERFA|nr:hypothetical protein HUG17_8906 [Dermatophagoides farinae]